VRAMVLMMEGRHVTSKAGMRPDALAAMKEMGINTSGHRSESVDEFAGKALE
jgi:protein-tyrosine-phosphatase